MSLVGQRFGRLVVSSKNGDARPQKWACLCDCGNTHIAREAHMKSGRTKSCGCLNRELIKARSTKHGQSHRTPEYKTWVNIRGRCEDPKNISFKYYGEKGIKVCERWQTFSNFFSDMGLKPSPDHSIDRKDNIGDYAPGNCRWATEEEQQNNRGNNVLITHDGETGTDSMWCARLGFPRQTITARLGKGWSVQRAITTPLRKHKDRRAVA